MKRCDAIYQTSQFYRKFAHLWPKRNKNAMYRLCEYLNSYFNKMTEVSQRQYLKEVIAKIKATNQ